MSVTFSTDDYVVPEWSHLPHLAYHLQIIKEGSIIGNVNLKPKQFILVGRVNDLCDLFIDNPSVSRKHAIIQFKANDDFPYIYDLGGTHGTEVNRKKLPPRAYQKLNPFDMIKFGLSSRYYVMRCPSLEAKQKEQLNDADNKFQQILAQKNRQLSKQELKDKYLQMLENDPYFKANNLSKKLEGRQAKRDINGVDWGISDQYDVYSYRNQSQLQLQSDILRRLPGLDQVQLNKISDYETNLRKYEQIQSELNELCNKQKRQFGLEQKLRDKKQKLQKRFVEGLEMLEKSEDWIRVNIFGEKQMKVVKKERAEKEDDTFEDDEFFDRTLKQKGEKKDKKMQQKLKQRQNSEIFTTQDFWKLQKQLRSELKYLLELQNQEKGKQAELQEQQQIKQQQQQEDDLDAYMKQNNEDLLKQQLNINQQRIRQSINKVKQIKDYLIPLIGVGEVQKIQDEERGIGGNCQSGDVDQEKLKKQREVQNKIGETLNKLEIIRQIQQDIDEDDINILNYYKGKTIEQDDEDQNKNEKPQFRPRPDTLNQEQHEHEEPSRKLRPSLGISRDQSNKEQQQCFDLTKYG